MTGGLTGRVAHPARSITTTESDNSDEAFMWSPWFPGRSRVFAVAHCVPPTEGNGEAALRIPSFGAVLRVEFAAALEVHVPLLASDGEK